MSNNENSTMFDGTFKEESIRVYLQPKIASDTKSLIGAEALSRLVDAEGHIIPPMQFIAALEKSGKIIDLDFYVLNFIAGLISKWMDDGIQPVTISFNLSPVHFFSSTTLVEDISAIAEKHDVAPEFIEIEVTESVFFEESGVIMKKVEALRKHGFKVSIDGFGSGSSPMNRISMLPVDVVKFDRVFVKNSLHTPNGGMLMRGLINILKQIDLDIVCEGVETEEEEEMIMGFGCTDMQGYLYDKPIPVEEFEAKYIY